MIALRSCEKIRSDTLDMAASNLKNTLNITDRDVKIKFLKIKSFSISKTEEFE